MNNPSQSFITTDLKLAKCVSCQALIVRGHSGGFPVKLDLAPIPDLMAELAVRMRSLKTFELVGEFSNLQAEYRSINELQSAVHKPTALVLGDHRCQEVEL